MAYNVDKIWEAHVGELEPVATTLMSAIRDGKALYDEWQSFRNARTDADIATDMTAAGGRSVTASEIADMDAAFSAFDSIMRYLDNDTPPSGIDQGFALRVFS
jgi:hypothetical protein